MLLICVDYVWECSDSNRYGHAETRMNSEVWRRVEEKKRVEGTFLDYMEFF
jgi:hypothetical protein